MKPHLLPIIAIASLTLCHKATYAKPADPRPHTYTQPDGSKVTVTMRGDERGHIFLSEDNYLLVRKDDAFYYADVDATGMTIPSAYLAKPVEKRTDAERRYLAQVDMDKAFKALDSRRLANPMLKAPRRGPGLFGDADFPTTGDQKVLVIIVDYPNLGFTVDDPLQHFTNMLTQQGYSEYGGTGSIYDYFSENSAGQFTPDFDVYGPVTMDHNYSYYGSNDWWGNDSNAAAMIIEACQKIDDQVDFSQYDRNNDGYIDNVYVFYAGKGEASYGSADTIWPHSWNVTVATSTPYYFDGVRLDRYACSNEWESNAPDGIGTFVHEFSHVLGLPDLYCTSYGTAFTPGEWSVLDSGPYNNDGRTPPGYGAFERYALGWLEPTVIDGPATISLDNVNKNEAYIIPTGDDNEYFLLENRQQEGWDAYIPGHGMLVWHVDYKQSVWDDNTVNNNSSHQYVDIEEADNKKTETTRDGDSFPGRSKVTSFTDDTKPSMKTWGGKALQLPLTEIDETDGIITFKVAGGVEPIGPAQISDVTDITPTGFTLSWSAVENATDYAVNVYRRILGATEQIEYAGEWHNKKVGDQLTATVTGLLPATQYFCTVKALGYNCESAASDEVSVMTLDPTLDMMAVQALDATNVESESFTANWNDLPGATDYMLSVYTKERIGSPETDVCDFTDGVTALPQGWSTSSKLSFANASYSGNAVPSLRLAADEAYLQSPVYDSDVCTLTFWHRGSSVADGNTIKIQALVDEEWTPVAEVPIVNAAGGATVQVTDFPDGARSVRIVYSEAEHKGSLAIDDVVVGYGRSVINVTFGDYDTLNVGCVTAHDVQGTTPESTYYYKVAATDGELTSLVSNEITVMTSTLTTAPIAASGARVYTAAGSIVVKGIAGTAVKVYDATGRLVSAGKTSADGSLYINMRTKGLYIVRIGNKASKITL